MVQDQQKIEGSFLNGHPLWSTSLIAGGVARIWAVTLVSPLELIRTKMQSKKLSYQGIFKFTTSLVQQAIQLRIFLPIKEVGVAIRGLVRSQGFFGLWQGLTPSLLRDVPFSGNFTNILFFKHCIVSSFKAIFFYIQLCTGRPMKPSRNASCQLTAR